MQAVAHDPVSRARTMFDIINEPDVVEMRWESYVNSSGYEMPGAADVYHQMLDIGYNINPGKLLESLHHKRRTLTKQGGFLT